MTPDMVPLVFDTGASITITPIKTDFIGPIKPVQHVQIKGIASGLQAAGIGDVSYSFVNDSGATQTLCLRNCLYVPDCVVRLICPRQIGAETGNPADGLYATQAATTLIVHGQHTTIKYDTLSQLPILFTKPGIQSFINYTDTLHACNATLSTGSGSGNLTKRQKEKLYLHEMCAHEGFKNLNSWIRAGYFPKVDPSLALEPDPMCAACAFGKARRTTHNTHTGHISHDHTMPGDGVSSDGLESGTPGRPFTTKGSASKTRYNYVSFWVDHATAFVYVTFHSTKAATELVKSKLEFETFADRFNVRIRNIRADNGVYAAQLFRDACLKKQQNLTFCAVGAHWQNGIAERFIGTITQRARTILLHAMSRWPEVIQEDMWTYAIRHAVNFHNVSIRKQQTQSPYEKFTGQTAPWAIHDFRVFGSPTYVLHKALQDGTSHSKWRSRAWLGVYVGTSTCHSSAIPLIYNPISTHISPQYHVIYDEYFMTVSPTTSLDQEAYLKKLYDTSARWLHQDAFSEHPYLFEEFWDPNMAPANPKKRRNTSAMRPEARGSPQANSPGPCASHNQPELRGSSYPANPSLTSAPTSAPELRGSPHPGPTSVSSVPNPPPGSAETPSEDHPAASNVHGQCQLHNSSAHAPIPIITGSLGVSMGATSASMDLTSDPAATGTLQGPTTSANSTPQAASPLLPHHAHRPHYDYVDRSNYYLSYRRRRGIDGTIPILMSAGPCLPCLPDTTSPAYPNLANIFSAYITLPHETIDTPLHAFSIVDNKADTLTQSQMLKAEDSPQFIASQPKEIQGLLDMKVFEILPINTKPSNARLLSSIWSYRRKRSPVGKILKHKARICVDGSQQQYGRDYWEVYAPVVSWPTIRLMLLLSSILGLKERQVDYTQAFPQAPLSDPVFMKMPQGWHIDEHGQFSQHPDPTFNDRSHYIKLNKNLYGCKQAARNWFKHLTQGLLKEGFKQSTSDPCLFLRKDCILVVYTDDCIIFAQDDTTIDILLRNLSQTFLLEDQGSVQDYLGIRIIKDPLNKSISMSQPGLIESVLADLNLLQDQTKHKDTPSVGILYPDRDGIQRQDSWNYRSVIGKLNYIAQNTRPDISFAVHQCARYSAAPTALHELAVKRIGRYLLATRDKGLILHPTHDFKLDMFVDADFAGMWHREYSELRECALSRTGYIITYCGCPIHWASKLQSEIALSTTESEYIALSMASRELIPIRRLIVELHKHGLFSTPLDKPFSITHTSTLEASTIYEDNASCIVLAHSEGTKVRTKHISLKWHRFKDHIRAGDIKVVKIDTNLNWADILTKPLCKVKHESLRRFIMGW